MSKSFADRIRDEDRTASWGLDQSAKKAREMMLENRSDQGRPDVGSGSARSRLEVGHEPTQGRPDVGHEPTHSRPKVGPPLAGRPLADQRADHEPTLAASLINFDINTGKRDDDPVWYNTDKQAIVLSFLIKKESRVAKRSEMVKETGISIGTIKRAFLELTKNQFITKPKRWRNKGSSYSIHNEICARFMRERWPEIVKKYGNPPVLTEMSNMDQDMSRPRADLEPTIEPTPGQPSSRPVPYIEEEDILLLSSSIRPDKYDELTKLEFQQHHVKEIIGIWENKKYPLEDLQESLNRIEYQLQNKIPDAAGKQIGLGYVLNALKRGPYKKPDGYMTPAEKYAAEKLNEAKRVNEIMKEVFDLECNIWWNSLAPDERQNIYAGSSRQLKYESEKRAFREIYFNNNIFQFNPDTHSKQTKSDKKNQAVADNNAETDTSSIAKEHEQQTELKFRQMMDNPEGDLYKQCFDQLNDFAKKKSVKGGPAFEGAMLSVFKEVMETSDAGDDQNIGDQNNPPAAEGN